MSTPVIGLRLGARLVRSRMVPVACAFVLLAVGACSADQAPASDVRAGSVRGQSFPPGTVGRVASNYVLTMEAARRWYAVVGDLYRLSEQDSSFHLKLDFPLGSRLAQQVAKLDSIPAVAAAMRNHGLAPEEFVPLTVLIGAGWAALRLEDEDSSAALTNVDPALVTFFRQHRTELQALNDTIAHPRRD